MHFFHVVSAIFFVIKLIVFMLVYIMSRIAPFSRDRKSTDMDEKARLLNVLNDINYFTFCCVICYSIVIISNLKFRCLFLFSCNFFIKIFANVLFFVTATCFAGTTSPISQWRSHRAYFQQLLLKSMSVNKRFLLSDAQLNVSLSPDLKTPITLLSYSIAFSWVSALHSKFFPKNGTQMSL